MLKAGFDYVPNPYAMEFFGGIPDNPGEFSPDDIEWVTQFGYGVVSGHS